MLPDSALAKSIGIGAFSEEIRKICSMFMSKAFKGEFGKPTRKDRQQVLEPNHTVKCGTLNLAEVFSDWFKEKSRKSAVVREQ